MAFCRRRSASQPGDERGRPRRRPRPAGCRAACRRRRRPCRRVTVHAFHSDLRQPDRRTHGRRARLTDRPHSTRRTSAWLGATSSTADVLGAARATSPQPAQLRSGRGDRRGGLDRHGRRRGSTRRIPRDRSSAIRFSVIREMRNPDFSIPTKNAGRGLLRGRHHVREHVVDAPARAERGGAATAPASRSARSAASARRSAWTTGQMSRSWRSCCPTAGRGAERRVSPWPAHQARSAASASSRSSGPALEAQVLEEPPGPADLGAGPQAEELHDRVAVEVGPHPREVLLLRDLGDPLLEGVVGRRQRRRPPLVAGRASPSAPACAAGGAGRRRRSRSGAPRSRSTRRVPYPWKRRCRKVSRETASMTSFGVPQRRQPLAHQLGADHLVVVEGHPPARLVPPRRRLADVVQQRGQPQHQVRATRASASAFSSAIAWSSTVSEWV